MWVHKVNQKREAERQKKLEELARSSPTRRGMRSPMSRRSASKQSVSSQASETGPRSSVASMGQNIPYTRTMVKAALELRRMHHFRIQTDHQVNFVDPSITSLHEGLGSANKSMSRVHAELQSLARRQVRARARGEG